MSHFFKAKLGTWTETIKLTHKKKLLNLIRNFYGLRPAPHISFKHVRHNHLC